jgi:hypothetical protein
MSAQHEGLVDDRDSWRGLSHAKRLANYDQSWGLAAAAIETGIRNAMSLEDLVRAWTINYGRYHEFLPPGIRKQLNHVDFGKFSDEKPPHRLVVIDGHYVSSLVAPSTDALIDVIVRCIDPEVDCVVEFGSGLGINLARLRLRLPTAPLTYIACEPTAAGRQAARSMFSTDPAARLQDYSFDYCRPNLDFLDGFRKIVAFTSHSIEQVPVLGESFYRMLLDTNVAACVHIEPVGWQRFNNIAEAVQTWHHDELAWKQFFFNYTLVLDDARVVDNAAVWSAFCGYNTDLLQIVSSAAASGAISVTDLAYDVIGLNPFNPSTVVAWRRNRALG